MTDVAINFIDNCFQIQLEKGDFKEDPGLETAVVISLFTNRRVPEAEIPPGLKTRQGWWGDLFAQVEGDQIGSKFWTFAREKISDALIPRFEREAQNALAWMLEDGVAQSVETQASFDEFNRLILDITITEPTGDQNQFAFLWDGQELRVTNAV